MGIAMATSFFSAVWVFWNRKHRVVVAGQPMFLYAICLGSAVMCLVILMSSYDESYGWTDEMLDKACIANPWLDTMGIILIYGSLFTKVRKAIVVVGTALETINCGSFISTCSFSCGE